MNAPSPTAAAADGAVARAHTILRGLGFLMLLLMLVSIGYSVWIALSNWGTIGV